MKPRKLGKNSVIQVKPWNEIQDETHIFYESLNIYWCLLKFLGLLPFTKYNNGEIKLKYFSVSSIYCLIMYSLMTYPTFMALNTMIKELSNPKNNFEDTVFLISFLLAHSCYFFFPWTHWLELKYIEDVFAKWKKFQIQYKNLTGEKMPHLKKRFIIVRIFAISLITMFGVGGAMFISYSNSSIYELLAMLHISLVLQIHFSLYMANAHLLRLIIADYKKNFRKAVVGKKKYTLIAKYNALWVDLADLTESVGGIFYKIYGLMLLGYFINLTLNGYSILQYVNGFNMKRLAATLIWIFLAFLLFTTCGVGEHLSREVGERFIDELTDYKIHSQDEELIDEIEMFIDSIQVTPHKVCYQGYAKIDNTLFISMLSTIITYLVVVIQFSN